MRMNGRKSPAIASVRRAQTGQQEKSKGKGFQAPVSVKIGGGSLFDVYRRVISSRRVSVSEPKVVTFQSRAPPSMHD
jgi:hypothetical protein